MILWKNRSGDPTQVHIQNINARSGFISILHLAHLKSLLWYVCYLPVAFMIVSSVYDFKVEGLEGGTIDLSRPG